MIKYFQTLRQGPLPGQVQENPVKKPVCNPSTNDFLVDQLSTLQEDVNVVNAVSADFLTLNLSVAA
jgi:hypothetical protein